MNFKYTKQEYHPLYILFVSVLAGLISQDPFYYHLAGFMLGVSMAGIILDVAIFLYSKIKYYYNNYKEH